MAEPDIRISEEFFFLPPLGKEHLFSRKGSVIGCHIAYDRTRGALIALLERLPSVADYVSDEI
jgi:hypothetical protein